MAHTSDFLDISRLCANIVKTHNICTLWIPTNFYSRQFSPNIAVKLVSTPASYLGEERSAIYQVSSKSVKGLERC
jgi:hypothetical protein